MATLTYNPNDPAQPEFSEQELADIQLGEKIQQAESDQLDGKYKAAQEVEQAQIDLTSDDGEVQSDAEDTSEEQEEEETEEEVVDEDYGFTDEDIQNLQSIAGGAEQYNEMIEWAAENVPSHEVEMFNQVMDMESPEAAFFAIHALRYAYQNAVGYEGRMLQGKAAADNPEVFRSQAELVAAMDDPRYEKDPAYRMDVEQKLSRSNLVF